MQEKLNKVQYAEEQARVEKERAELDVMKLERELEKLQYQVRRNNHFRLIHINVKDGTVGGEERQQDWGSP